MLWEGEEYYNGFFEVHVRILQVKHYLRTEASYPTPISSMEQ